MDYLLWRLARSALRRARSGEHWAWWLLAIALFAIHRLHRRAPEVRTLTIKPGDHYSLSVVDPSASTGGSGTRG